MNTKKQEKEISNNELAQMIIVLDKKIDTSKNELKGVINILDKKTDEKIETSFNQLATMMMKGFESVDKKFEIVDAKFDELRNDMNTGFRKMNNQFNDLEYRYGRRLDAIENRIYF